MTAPTNLGRPAWLCRENTKRVMAALETARPGGARFVGGCVRNALMGVEVDDVDIATQLTPQQVIGALEADGIRAIPTGLEHGTITAVCDGEPFEITTLRRDVETDGRRAVVAFTEDWAEDAARRDFRMNALYADAEGRVFDPVGGGVEDALQGRVIFIGDADQRLKEDYLRILRFFRFNAWYGQEMDADGLAACARQKAGLSKIAAERIWKELEKLLRAPAPYDAVEAMHASGVLGVILPQAQFRESLAVAQARTRDPFIRFVALLPRDGEVAKEVAQSLRLSNREAERLKAWATVAVPGGKLEQLQTLAYHFGKEPLLDLITVSAQDQFYNAARSLFETWEVPVLPVRGQDLLDRGFKGLEIGETLRDLEDKWVESDFTLSRDQLLNSLPQ
ncbi:MAG: CCA tRNA nucleotidyltransferase [Hyphomonadaceae bacterium]|nr:CCA tRNA nucleotidyltransferase [Hyphomonadaceae bacterium]